MSIRVSASQHRPVANMNNAISYHNVFDAQATNSLAITPRLRLIDALVPLSVARQPGQSPAKEPERGSVK